MEQATFAAGCFWGVKNTFRQVKGVTSTTADYTGGHFSNPCYLDVCAWITGTQFCVMNKKTFSRADQHSFLEDNLAGKSSCG